jgi:hypothetical protein
MRKKIQVQNFHYLQVIWMYITNIQIKFHTTQMKKKIRYKANKRMINKTKNIS